MTFGNILIYIAVLGFMVFRRVQGKAILSTKQLFFLPVILTIVGYGDATHHAMNAVDVTFTVIGCAVSLALGALRGMFNRISVRNGAPWVQWGPISVVLFAANIVAKLLVDAVCVVAGGSLAAVTSSLLLAVGLMLAGESAAVWLRLQAGPRVVRS